MSLRAVWIIPVNKEAQTLIFSRYFPSVEARCRSTLGNSHVNIPPEKEFVKALLLEVGLKEGDVFVESRDQCDKQVLYPAFQLQTEQGNLWPVVVMESKGLIYCALPYEDGNHTIGPSQFQVSLVDVPSIALALEVLNGLAHCINSSSTTLSQGSTAMTELLQYVSVSLPFGRPLCCDASIARQLLTSTGKGKAKLPAWNPIPHKGKSHVVLHIREEVRCMQFNHDEMKDSTEVYGTVTCKAEVEGTAPEISLVLAQSMGGLVVSPGVSNVENIGQTTSRLRFHPANSQPLCHYTLPNITEPPIHGAFTMKMSDNTATIYLQLQLRNNVKNLFQQLEVQIPFAGLVIVTARPNYSQGSVAIHSKNILVWNIGSKFPSKTLDVTLNAVVKLKKLQKKIFSNGMEAATIAETSSATHSADFSIDRAANVNSAFAVLLFKIADYTYSGIKVDPQSIVVSTAAKVRCSVSSEFVSNIYKLWNNEGDVPVVTDSPAEELKMLLARC